MLLDCEIALNYAEQKLEELRLYARGCLNVHLDVKALADDVRKSIAAAKESGADTINLEFRLKAYETMAHVTFASQKVAAYKEFCFGMSSIYSNVSEAVHEMESAIAVAREAIKEFPDYYSVFRP